VLQGADVNHENKDNISGTPLFAAASRNELGIARLLLEAGANPDAGCHLRGALVMLLQLLVLLINMGAYTGGGHADCNVNTAA
jgi:hypothetical protein